MLTINPITNWTTPNIIVPDAVTKVDIISTFLGMCSPKLNELKTTLTWRIPPIVRPRNIVMRILAHNDPNYYKNRNVIATENIMINTFLSLSKIFKNLRKLLDYVWSTPHLLQVALSYIMIFPTSRDPKIEEISNNIVMYPLTFSKPWTYK